MRLLWEVGSQDSEKKFAPLQISRARNIQDRQKSCARGFPKLDGLYNDFFVTMKSNIKPYVASTSYRLCAQRLVFRTHENCCAIAQFLTCTRHKILTHRG